MYQILKNNIVTTTINIFYFRIDFNKKLSSAFTCYLFDKDSINDRISFYLAPFKRKIVMHIIACISEKSFYYKNVQLKIFKYYYVNVQALNIFNNILMKC